MNKKALSFIEVLISVAIIVILAIVWLAYKNSYDENKYNSKVIADTSSLKNSFLAYKQENWNLPNPGWNKNYYKKNSSYSHDENWAFGVHWFVTNEMISKKYLNYLPLDPRVNQFYAYWKTLDNNSFEIASILVDDWDYITKIEWNYDWQELVWLIREYNWPQFLYDQSTSNFPYNPEENKMTARIASYTGSVSINGETTDILAKVLVPWTIIETSSNSNAQIFYSDWSRSTLEENSKLEIKEMSYKNPDKEHNLLTSVKLFLENGTIWTKASRLNQNGSEFEVTTQDTTAAVRWTIFWVQRKNGQTNVNLQVWEIDLKDTNGNLIETITVLPGTAEIQRTIKNWVKQATITPIHFNDKEEIFPSNLKLKIESIKENSGKQINIVNTFSKGKLYVNHQEYPCNSNGDLLECNVWTIPNNSKAKFCLKLTGNKKSCTNEIIINNLVYTKVKQNIPTNKEYKENKVENICKIWNISWIIKWLECIKIINLNTENNKFLNIWNNNYIIKIEDNDLVLNKWDHTYWNKIKVKWDSNTSKLYIYKENQKISQSNTITKPNIIEIIKK